MFLSRISIFLDEVAENIHLLIKLANKDFAYYNQRTEILWLWYA